MCSASLRELTAGIKARGVDSRWCLEKADLVQLYNRLQQVLAMPNRDTTGDTQKKLACGQGHDQPQSVQYTPALLGQNDQAFDLQTCCRQLLCNDIALCLASSMTPHLLDHHSNHLEL